MRLGKTIIPSAVQRPVGLRMRQDLVWFSRRVGGEQRYILKDPITLAHHQLWPEEFALLEMLDGETSLSDMKERFEQRFKPARLDYSRLEILHGQFYRNGLVLSEHLGQGQQLLKRHSDQRLSQFGQRASNLLAIRFRGINPDPLLEFLNARIGVCFSGLSLMLSACFVLMTSVFMLAQLPNMHWQLPDLAAYLTPYNLLWLGLAFVALKMLHEIGHGLACKHYGGECSELGIMLLVFTPCLYCDVSDSWMIGDRWKRAFVAAAGMYFEVVAAAVCAWLWWFSQPGLLHSISFNMMLLGSVGTVVFNANPLLRYDGYFVLSDLLDAPNLWQQSYAAFWKSIRDFFYCYPAENARHPEASRRVLWFYACVSLAYRWGVTMLILFFVAHVLQSLRLEVLGVLLLPAFLMMILLQPLRTVHRFVTRPIRSRRLRRGRVAQTLVLLLLVVGMIFWLPLPASVVVPVFVRAANAQPVIPLVDGQLVFCLPDGSRVNQGDVIARLESPSLQLECMARRGDLARQQARLQGLESRRGMDAGVSSLIPTVREAIAGLELEVSRLERAREQLVLRASVSGKVIAPVTRLQSSAANRIDFWSGSLLQPENLGCHVLCGTHVCDIGEPANMEAMAYLTQSQIELIEPGLAARVKIRQHPGAVLSGQVTEIGSTAQSELPLEVLRSRLIPTKINELGNAQVAEPLYAARLQLHHTSPATVSQISGWARIQIKPRPLVTRIVRWFYQTFAIGL